MNDKMGVLLGIGVTAAALIGFIPLLMHPAGLETDMVIIMALTLALVAGAAVIITQRAKDVKKGLPVQDELARKVSWKAGAYSYYATIWIAVGALWYDGLAPRLLGVPGLTVMQTVAGIVLLPGLVFIALNFYFNRKGDV